MKPIYMDNNATTRVAPEVVEEMLPYFSDLYGNPSSMHAFGGNVGAKLKTAREQVATLLGAQPEEILFTSCGTESDSTAIHAALQSNPDKRHIITTRVEHPAVKSLGEHLAKNGYRVTFVPVDRQGRLDLDYLYKNLSDDTAIVSVMWANNETGTIFPGGRDCQKGARARHRLSHRRGPGRGQDTDQHGRFGHRHAVLSGHKLHAPKGIGVLYLRKGTKFAPFLVGGHQEAGRRAGTENTASIIGMGRAAQLAMDAMEDENTRVRALRDRLETRLLKPCPSMVNGDPENRLPNTTSIAFEFVEGEAILLLMDQYGICASSGSACTSGSLEPSHVLRAMGVPFTAAHGSIRYSLSTTTPKKRSISSSTRCRRSSNVCARCRPSGRKA
jgi:cysteine desulfurase